MTIVTEPPASMPDVQSSQDTRQIPIQRVGVRGVRHPLTLLGGAGEPQATIADWELTVALPSTDKGTHMSRFMALLEQHRATPATPEAFCRMAGEMLELLDAPQGDMTASFPYFMDKAAPVSGVRSLMDYQVRWIATARRGEAVRFSMAVQVPVTSLCPCSKSISEYGAHNQRSHVRVRVDYAAPAHAGLEDLIRGIEGQASCELWGLLKRVDEKYVTERAYDNPKFVEDLVRDVAVMLRALPGVEGYRIEAENFESIHNHSAYALVTSDL
ncbi:GTP cyclohydrolase FolE2 [Castellaniella sp. GW247-6E4]|uniref:GTP cyclohydrolase FolE2 n=1 Tax=Castellaniella sp. GW247-6E4 TaxID=3140380 RepID=UPI003314FE5A